MNQLLILAAGMAAGWFISFMYRDQELEAMNRAQQQRGDYWFDRYQEEIKTNVR